MMTQRRFMLVLGVVAAACLTGCSSTEHAYVDFSYVVEPDRGLPHGMDTIAIMPAKVGPTTDPKWSDMCVTVMQSLVNESRNRFGTEVTVVERRDAKVVWDEADLAAAGMSTGSARGGGQVLATQGTLLSNINVKVETHKGKQRTLSGLDIFGGGGHGWGWGGTNIDTTEVETVTRNMTVQTEFKLIDTANGKVWAHHSPKTYSATDRTKASPIFGSSRTEAELTPRDEIIATLVEQGAREFISQLMPCRIDVQAHVRSSGNAECIQGVKMLRGEMYDTALGMFKSALGADPGDDRAAYGAGVACEVMGQYDDAIRYYKRACAERGDREYRNALDRMKAYATRIRG
ncbi:MAG: tetratricopeptide repeat protein [Phycisphaerae bacterium]|jgi:hypothetical protein